MVEPIAPEQLYALRWTLLFEKGLYSPLRLSIRQFREVSIRGERCDAYCVECGQNSPMKSLGGVDRAYQRSDGSIECYPGVRTVEIACTRVETHVMRFYFMNDDASITKIGQHPSVADIAQGDLGRIRRVMDDVDRDELVRAIGLHAHGIGVGSFVYLRRILERLVVKAERDAKITPDGDRFVDRIKALHGHVPDFLADNAHLHGILSKGIHEMSEDECTEAFPVVRAAIEEVFEDRLAELRRSEARARTAKELNALNSQLAQRDSKATGNPAPDSNA